MYIFQIIIDKFDIVSREDVHPWNILKFAVFEENFNGNSLDLSKWDIEVHCIVHSKTIVFPPCVHIIVLKKKVNCWGGGNNELQWSTSAAR